MASTEDQNDFQESIMARELVKEGILSKRCRWCWRPRYVELICDPLDFSGPQNRYTLLIYDQSHRSMSRKIRIDDIITIRAGKQFSFQIYLTTGRFLLLQAESSEVQAAWMAEIKTALSKGNIFSVQVSSPTIAFSLEHALLYCIGVNLPSHKIGQLDRVLVLASPINDVNLHAWNLNRVTQIMILEAGIQMELCSSCMGHRKNTITFLMSPRVKNDCKTFLLKEMCIPDNPEQFTTNSPIYYTIPHRCANAPPIPPPRPPMYTPRSFFAEPPEPPLYYNEAELAVLSSHEKRPFQPSHHRRRRPPPPPPPTTTLFHSHSSPPPTYPPPSYPPPSYPPPPPPPLPPPLMEDDFIMQAPPISEPQKLHRSDTSVPVEATSVTGQHKNCPPLPPRTCTRPNCEKNTPAMSSPQSYLECHTTFSTTSTEEYDLSFFTTPYQVSHRIYISESGQVKHEPEVYGSGGGEVHIRKRSHGPPIPPRRMTKPTPPRSKQTTPRFLSSSNLPPLPPKSQVSQEKSRSWSSITSTESCERSSKCTAAPVKEDIDDQQLSAPPLPPKQSALAQADMAESTPLSSSTGEVFHDISMTFHYPAAAQPAPPKPRSSISLTANKTQVRQIQSASQLGTKESNGSLVSTIISIKPPVPLPRRQTLTKVDQDVEYGGSHSADSSPVMTRRTQRSLSSGSLDSEEYKRITVLCKVNDCYHITGTSSASRHEYKNIVKND